MLYHNKEFECSSKKYHISVSWKGNFWYDKREEQLTVQGNLSNVFRYSKMTEIWNFYPTKNRERETITLDDSFSFGESYIGWILHTKT